MSRFASFVAELFRRKVVRLLFAYVAIFWLLAQGFASLFPVLGWPDWLLRAFIVAGVAVIPVLALLSWKFDLIPPQLVRDAYDLEDVNPTASWAMLRHDNLGAGYISLEWGAEGEARQRKRYFRPVTIGREPSNDIELPDARVSRYHAVLWAEGGAWRVRDLDSTNGTFIDQQRVNGTVALPLSCELRCHPQGPSIRVRIDKAQETLAS